MSDTFPTDFVSALYAEHSATPGGYRTPEDVVAAEQALTDLLARTEGRKMSRDEKRLANRYTAVREAHFDSVMAKHSRAASTSTNGEAS